MTLAVVGFAVAGFPGLGGSPFYITPQQGGMPQLVTAGGQPLAPGTADPAYLQSAYLSGGSSGGSGLPGSYTLSLQEQQALASGQLPSLGGQQLTYVEVGTAGGLPIIAPQFAPMAMQQQASQPSPQPSAGQQMSQPSQQRGSAARAAKPRPKRPYKPPHQVAQERKLKDEANVSRWAGHDAGQLTAGHAAACNSAGMRAGAAAAAIHGYAVWCAASQQSPSPPSPPPHRWACRVHAAACPLPSRTTSAAWSSRWARRAASWSGCSATTPRCSARRWCCPSTPASGAAPRAWCRSCKRWGRQLARQLRDGRLACTWLLATSLRTRARSSLLWAACGGGTPHRQGAGRPSARSLGHLLTPCLCTCSQPASPPSRPYPPQSMTLGEQLQSMDCSQHVLDAAEKGLPEPQVLEYLRKMTSSDAVQHYNSVVARVRALLQQLDQGPDPEVAQQQLEDIFALRERAVSAAAGWLPCQRACRAALAACGAARAWRAAALGLRCGMPCCEAAPTFPPLLTCNPRAACCTCSPAEHFWVPASRQPAGVCGADAGKAGPRQPR